MKKEILHSRSSVYVDGYTYQLSLCFSSGQMERIGELPHNHAQYELHAVLAGEVFMELEGSPVLVMNIGACCVIPPHIYHLRRLGSDTTRCCVLSIDSSKGAPLCAGEMGCVNLSCAAVLMQYLTTLEKELSVRQIGSDANIQSLLTLILTNVLRELTDTRWQPLAAKGISAHREELIDNYFASHYGQNVSARDLAEYIGITTRQLARVMQKRYGCTFRQHLLEIRLYHARKQLAESAEPVCQIAGNCGFSCQGTFATAFRKHTGCSPSQYRNQKHLQN